MTGGDLNDDSAQYEALKQEHLEAMAEESGDAPPGPDYGRMVEQVQQQQRQPAYDQQQHSPAQYADDLRQTHHQQQSYQTDIDEDPVEHFNQRIQTMEQHNNARNFWQTVQESENHARQEYGDDYDRACEHLEQGRIRELKKMFPDGSQQAQYVARNYGFRSPAELRRAVLDQDRVGVARHAMQTGVPPAMLYYKMAQERGYRSQAPLSRSQMRSLTRLGRSDPETFDAAWDKLAAQGKL